MCVCVEEGRGQAREGKVTRREVGEGGGGAGAQAQAALGQDQCTHPGSGPGQVTVNSRT